MKILIVGGGGREHALAWKAAKSELVSEVIVAPGNAGTAMEPGVTNVDIGAEDIPRLVEFAAGNGIGLTIIGPEVPLVMGIVDAFDEAGLRCFGPSAAAAQLEGSKDFTKRFLKRHGIPTAEYASFTRVDEAVAYLQTRTYPQVIKADGLAAGKGVVIASDRDDAIEAVNDMLAGNRFGDAGHRIVVEDFLAGEEASYIVMVDGEHILPMATSQDHKAAYDGDQGPNTGGMGAYSPAPIVSDELEQVILDRVIRPTVKGMRDEGMPFTGFLYAGIMIDQDGAPRVLEFNTRFGDPETQPILMRLQSDLVAHCLAALDGELQRENVRWDPRPALGVVLAAEGYPSDYNRGDSIDGVESVSPHCKVFHAGTALSRDKLVTSGGRVLCVTAMGDGLGEARENAYLGAARIHWNGCWYRKDIGHRAIS